MNTKEKKSPVFQRFLENESTWRDKWRSLDFGPEFQLTEEDFRPELTPFYGLPVYETLDDPTRKKLFFEYIKMIAEAQILLEQILIYGFYFYKKRVRQCESEVVSSIDKLACEELYHSQAYKDFLHAHPRLEWPEKRVFPRHHWARLFLAWFIKKAPLGMTLPGAKIEAFSLAYTKMLRKVYGKPDANGWMLLNHYHQQDEALHVPLEFDIYNSTLKSAGAKKTLLSTLTFVLYLQYSLFSGSWSVVRTCFPEAGIGKRLLYCFYFAKWSVRCMPAFNEGRVLTKKLFQDKKPRFQNILGFMHW